MLISKYRAVLRQQLRKSSAALAASCVLLCATPALAADYAVGTGKTYTNLQALQAASISFSNGDTITIYNHDFSLTAPFNFGGAAVTLQGSGPISLQPSAPGVRLFTADSGSVTLASNLVVEGFVNTATGVAGRGGAIRVENGARVNAQNVTFRNNQASGGFDVTDPANKVYSGGGAVLVTGAGSQLNADGATFANNQAAAIDGIGGIGGALYIRDSARTTANNAIFSGNTAHFGGGLYVTGGSTLSINDATFTNNAANGSGGAGYLSGSSVTADKAQITDNKAVWGGALYVDHSTLTAHNAIFGNNQAKQTLSGGGYGGAVNLQTSMMDADNAVFNGNRAELVGGAVFLNNSDFTANGAVFKDNTAIAHAGAVYLYGGRLVADNAVFNGNKVEQCGGALYLTSDIEKVDAPGIIPAKATLTNVVFTGNQAAHGGAAWVGSNGILTVSNATFTGNTAIGGNGGAIYLMADIIERPDGSKAANENTTVNIHTDPGKTTLFKGNTQQLGLAPASANSIFFIGRDDCTARLNVDGDGTLDMQDPMSSEPGVSAYNIAIAKNGGGTWKLGGDNQFRGGSTAFDVNAGTLELYENAGIGIAKGAFNVNAGTFKLGKNAKLTITSGSFNLYSNGTLSSHGGNVIAAPTITFYDESTTAVDLAGGSLALNGNVTIGTDTTLDLASYQQGLHTVLVSDKPISGGFTHLTAGGQTLDTSPITLSKFLNGATISKTTDLKAINVHLGGLVWNNTTPGTQAHGTFDIATDFTVSDVLADNTATVAHSFGWDGKTLTKTGLGNLTLTGANTYSGGTVIDGGTLTVSSLAALGSGGITNNASLNFYRPGATAGQTIAFANRYTGSGTLGIQASLTETARWSDLLTFAAAPAAPSGVYFTFTDGSNLRYMPKEGLHVAQLAAADGKDGTFSLAGTSLAGASQLSISTTDNQNYYLLSSFNPSLGKVYSETAAAGLGQAAGLHGKETFGAIGKAAAGAAGGNTGVYAGGGRSDVRHNTGSHADLQGNNFALALAWEKGKTTWGIIGQSFDGSYTTTHTASVGGAGQTIHSAGDLKQRDLGLFAEYRPDDSGRYYQGLIKTGSSKNDFRADNANGGSRFRSDRDLFGLSLGGGFVKQTAPNRSLETYQHLIYTLLGSDQVTDSIGQDIRFDSDNSLRLLAGARWTQEQQGKASFYAGAALDYEFRGKTGATINSNRADGANLKGLTGILELGFSAKQSETLTLDGALYGYVGKKEGLAGSLTLTKRF